MNFAMRDRLLDNFDEEMFGIWDVLVDKEMKEGVVEASDVLKQMN